MKGLLNPPKIPQKDKSPIVEQLLGISGAAIGILAIKNETLGIIIDQWTSPNFLWFVYTIAAIIVPFTSSKTSNILRFLNSLFGFSGIRKKRFYAFMASPKIPWKRLWQTLWRLLPDPLTDNRRPRLTFESKLAQAAGMITEIAEVFRRTRLLLITDSWFGNNALWKPLHDQLGIWVDMISRFRSKNSVFELPGPYRKAKGRPRKYGRKMGTEARYRQRRDANPTSERRGQPSAFLHADHFRGLDLRQPD